MVSAYLTYPFKRFHFKNEALSAASFVWRFKIYEYTLSKRHVNMKLPSVASPDNISIILIMKVKLPNNMFHA